ncbi:MAG: nucleotidyltransferase family protein [Tepidisphaeraceae bacterium]|jgi:uncharacterized protein
MKLHEIEIDDTRLAQFCRRNGIRELLFFGSITRSDFRPDSDIDVIVHFNGVDNLGLFELGRLQLELTELFGRQVHLHTDDMIHPYLRNRIRRSAQVAYAA